MKQASRTNVIAALSLLIWAACNGAVSATSRRAGAEMSLRSLSTSGLGSMAAIERTMTMEKAHKVLQSHKGANTSAVMLIQNLLETHSSSALRSTAGKRRGVPSGYAGIQGARLMLNGMISESNTGLDLEITSESDYHTAQTALIEETTQMIAAFSAKSTQAYSDMLTAQGLIYSYKSQLESEQGALKTHKASCASTLANLRGEESIVSGDIDVMESVLGLTKCDNAQGLFLMQCHARVKKQRFVTINRPDIRMKLRTLKARRLVREHLNQFYQNAKQDEPGMALLEERAEHKASMQETMNLMHRPGAKGSINLLAEGMSDDPDANTDEGDLPQPVQATGPPKCNVAGSPACPQIRGKFLDIQSGLQTKLEQIQATIASTVKNCSDITADFDAEIKRLEELNSQQEAALATATKEKTDAEEAQRIKEKAKKQQNVDYANSMQTYKENKEKFRTEICGLGKIRSELLKVSGQTMIVQDCKVSEWTMEECTVTCGGGEMRGTRTILMSPHNGMECPPLEKITACNTQLCPVDCVAADWSGWSDCSAECGGGVRERTRGVITESANGGSECGETSRAESCNVGSCSADCVLSDWSDWSTCNKACTTGKKNNPTPFITRTKEVLKEATGGGQCWEFDDSMRRHESSCNNEGCGKIAKAMETDTIDCESKLDIILLLEASVYANNAFFSSVKNAGKKFVQSMVRTVDDDERVRLGVILSEGPSTFENYHKCVGKPNVGGQGADDTGDTATSTTAAPPNMETDCGVRWLHHLEDGGTTNDITDKIDNAQSDLDTLPFTSGALISAQADFMFGRPDAKSIVVVVTDGYPVSNGQTAKASKELIDGGVRLVWMVTKFAGYGETKSWTSSPVAENYVQVNDYNIDSNYKINELVSKICPVVVGGPTNTGPP